MADIFEAKLALNNGNHFVGKSPRGGNIDMDSRPAGEVHAGPTPMELFLQAIAGCAGMEALSILRKRKLEPEKFEIEIKGYKRQEIPRIFTRIEMIFHVVGEGINQRELERAINFSTEKYCSITNMLRSDIDLTWSFRRG